MEQLYGYAELAIYVVSRICCVALHCSLWLHLSFQAGIVHAKRVRSVTISACTVLENVWMHLPMSTLHSFFVPWHSYIPCGYHFFHLQPVLWLLFIVPNGCTENNTK